jgi:hypothetical protein
MPKKERGIEKGERERRKHEKYQDLGGVVFPSSLSNGGAGLDSFHHYARPSTKTCKAGFMTMTELAAYHVSEDPMFHAPEEGYIVSFVAFHERGFVTPSHRFLHLLLRHYGLELHHLTPSGVLHIAAFVTL